MTYGIEAIDIEGDIWYIVYRRWWIFSWNVGKWEKDADKASDRLKELCRGKV